MASASLRLARARHQWLGSARAGLSATAGVVGVALVGSLGRGTADDWSDVDLLVLTSGEPGSAVTEETLHALGHVGIRIVAPQNTRADAHSFGAGFVVDGVYLHTDWYVFAGGARWPVDARPLVGSDDPGSFSGRTFDDLNGEGPRGRPSTLSSAEAARHRLAMVPIAAKKIVRSSSDAAAFVQLLTMGGAASSGAAGLQALRRLVTELQDEPLLGVDVATVEAIERYIDLAVAALEHGGEPTPSASVGC